MLHSPRLVAIRASKTGILRGAPAARRLRQGTDETVRAGCQIGLPGLQSRDQVVSDRSFPQGIPPLFIGPFHFWKISDFVSPRVCRYEESWPTKSLYSLFRCTTQCWVCLPGCQNFFVICGLRRFDVDTQPLTRVMIDMNVCMRPGLRGRRRGSGQMDRAQVVHSELGGCMNSREFLVLESGPLLALRPTPGRARWYSRAHAAFFRFELAVQVSWLIVTQWQSRRNGHELDIQNGMPVWTDWTMREFLVSVAVLAGRGVIEMGSTGPGWTVHSCPRSDFHFGQWPMAKYTDTRRWKFRNFEGFCGVKKLYRNLELKFSHV